MLEKAKKYLCVQSHSLAWGLLFLTDPIMAPYYATALLDGIVKRNDVTIQDIKNGPLNNNNKVHGYICGHVAHH